MYPIHICYQNTLKYDTPNSHICYQNTGIKREREIFLYDSRCTTPTEPRLFKDSTKDNVLDGLHDYYKTNKAHN
jgi:hypothetical protein